MAKLKKKPNPKKALKIVKPSKKTKPSLSASATKNGKDKKNKKIGLKPASIAQDVKITAKKEKAAKKLKGKKEESDLDAEFIEPSFDSDEMGEYEEDLKAVEEMDMEEDSEEDWNNTPKESESEEIVLTDAEGNRYCRGQDCDQMATVDAYCRYHYLLFWKKIQIRKKILADGKLERYIEELTSRYPDKFLEMIRRDVRSEKDFLAAIQELEIDESSLDNDFEEDAQNFIDEVRGMGESPALDEEEF